MITPHEKENKNTPKTQQNTNTCQGQDGDGIIYAGDTKKIISSEDEEHLLQKTKKRRLCDAAKKPNRKMAQSHLINIGDQKHKAPFNQIQSAANAKILGKPIHIKGIQSRAINFQNVAKTENLGGAKKPIFTNKSITVRIRILMQNATVRTTLTYAPRTNIIQEGQQLKKDKCTNKWHR